MVVVPKVNGDVRIYTKLTNLNKSVLHPRFNLPTVDESLSRLIKSVFTNLDADSGFFKVPVKRAFAADDVIPNS